MKKRFVPLCFIAAYVLLPALAVGVQAYLSDKLVTASHAIDERYMTITPAAYKALHKATEKPVSL